MTAYNDNILVDYVDAFKFLNMLKNSLKKEGTYPIDQLEFLKRNLTETSNPVLIVLK